jgi:hypothetical protein
MRNYFIWNVVFMFAEKKKLSFSETFLTSLSQLGRQILWPFLTSLSMQNFMPQQDYLQPSRANRIMRNYFNASIVDSIQRDSCVQELKNVSSTFHRLGISHILFASPFLAEMFLHILRTNGSFLSILH